MPTRKLEVDSEFKILDAYFRQQPDFARGMPHLLTAGHGVSDGDILAWALV
jgi:hypothetical protein